MYGLSLKVDVGLMPSLYSKVVEDELTLQRPKKMIKNSLG